MEQYMRFASATTTEPDLEVATETLAQQIREQMDGRPADLVLTFLSSHFKPVAAFVAENLCRTVSPGLLLGCVSEGVIGREQEIEDQPAITLVAAHLPGVELAPFTLRPKNWGEISHNPASFRQTIGAPAKTKLFMMLADPISTPMDEVLDAFNAWYPEVPIIGGMASAFQRPGGSILLENGRVLTSGAIGVAFAGAFEVDLIVSQGCRPIGRPLTVTAAEENVIFGLEGEPPLDYLQDLMGQLSTGDRALLQNGLYIGRAIDPRRQELGRGDFLIRGVMGVDQDSGAIAVGDYIVDGERVQFHLRDATTASEDLEMMLAPQALFDAPQGAFLFSCNGRGTHLYNHPNGDIGTIQRILGGVHLAGFFCAGEIGPIGGRNFLHGHTASLALFRPAPEEA